MILATKHGDVQRDVSLGSLMQLNGMQLRGDVSASASPSEVAGLPGFQQAIRIASQAVAKLTLAVWRGQEQQRSKVTATWQARFFANPPNERDSWFFTWEGTEASLTARNNAYWLKSHDLLTSRVNRVQVWHPDHVQPRWNRQERRAEYRLLQEDGSWSDWLTSGEVLHFRAGAPSPGAIVSPSPIELHRRAFAIAVEKQRAEQAIYAKGVKRTVAVVYPDQITPEQVSRWRQTYLDGQADSDVKVFGGNPSIAPIGLSFDDMQWVETQQFSIEDIGRILGVPPSLLWAGLGMKGDKPLTPEHEEDRWFRYGLEPRRTRIEQTVAGDPDFFGVGARDYPAFVAGRPRGDARTESEMQVAEVQAGILLVDEARAERGLPPLPGGVGQIPQITPVGGAPNEPAPAPPPQQQTVLAPVTVVERSKDEATLGAAIASAVRDAVRDVTERPIAIDIHDEREHVLEAHLHLPEQPELRVEVSPTPVVVQNQIDVAPTPVTIENQVDVAAADVSVQLPEQPAPTINVTVPEPRAKTLTVERNGSGWIKSATIEED